MVPPRGRSAATPMRSRPSASWRSTGAAWPRTRRRAGPGWRRPPPRATRSPAYNLALLLLTSGADADLQTGRRAPAQGRGGGDPRRAACARRALSQGPRRRPRTPPRPPACSSARPGTAARSARSNTPSCSSTATACRRASPRPRAISAAPPPRATPSPRTASPAFSSPGRGVPAEQGRCRRLAHPGRRPGPQRPLARRCPQGPDRRRAHPRRDVWRPNASACAERVKS